MMKLLFVCLGNICRSAAAEAIMKSLLNQHGLSDYQVDSAGTAAYHQGELADARMRDHAAKREYDLTSISRQVVPEDAERFDWIVVMDEQNWHDIHVILPASSHHKIHRFADFCQAQDINEVPDPYYGGAQGFEHVIDILEDGCQGLLHTIMASAQQ